jgi:hypothetical protein
MCDEGFQSSLAAATLQELGLERATDVVGRFSGMARRRAAGIVRSRWAGRSAGAIADPPRPRPTTGMRRGTCSRCGTPVSAGTLAKLGEPAGGAGASAEDLWHRRTEMLFERFAVRWTIAGLPLDRQQELLGRYRMADQENSALGAGNDHRARALAPPGAEALGATQHDRSAISAWPSTTLEDPPQTPPAGKRKVST